MSEEITPKTPYTIGLIFYMIVLLSGIVLYFGWSILYNTWFDPGLYSISVVLIGFGLLGVFLYGRK